MGSLLTLVSRRAGIGALLVLFALVMPLAAYGQNAEMEATIRAALAEDPEAATLPSEEFEAMVSAIAEAARSEGLTAEDLQKPEPDPLTSNVDENAEPFIRGFSSDTKALLSLGGLLFALLALFFVARWMRTPVGSSTSGETHT